jgi:menaquinone reductase, multiheme cytochrome c subunit
VKWSGKLPFFAGAAIALAAGWLAFPHLLYRQSRQPLRFSHKVHAGEKVGLSCDTCHAIGEDGRFAGIPGIEQCVGCHEQTQGTSVDEKLLVDNYVTPRREIPWLVYARQPENVYFPHAAHVKLASLSCESCHGGHGTSDSLRPHFRNRISGYGRDIWGASISRLRIGHGEGMKMDDCANCHEQKKVNAGCLDCHK